MNAVNFSLNGVKRSAHPCAKTTWRFTSTCQTFMLLSFLAIVCQVTICILYGLVCPHSHHIVTVFVSTCIGTALLPCFQCKSIGSGETDCHYPPETDSRFLLMPVKVMVASACMLTCRPHAMCIQHAC